MAPPSGGGPFGPLSVTPSAEDFLPSSREDVGGGDQRAGDAQAFTPELRRQSSSRGKQRPKRLAEGSIPWSPRVTAAALPNADERPRGGVSHSMSADNLLVRLRETEAVLQESHEMQHKEREEQGAEIDAVRAEAQSAKERAKYAMTELAKLRKAAREEAAELRSRLEDTERLREEAAAARAELARLTEIHAAELAETLAEANRAHKLAQVESVQRLKEAEADLAKLKSHMVTAMGKGQDEAWVWEGEGGGEVDTAAVVDRLLEEVRVREEDATLAREMVERAEEEMKATSAALRAEVERSEEWKKELARLKARVAEVEEERERVVREAWAKSREGGIASMEVEGLRARLAEMEEERERTIMLVRSEVTRDSNMKVAEARAEVAREYNLKMAEARAEAVREYTAAVAEARAEVSKDYGMAVAEARAEVERDYGLRLAQMESDLLRAEREARASEGWGERLAELEAAESLHSSRVVELEGLVASLQQEREVGFRVGMEDAEARLMEERDKAVAEARDMAIARAEAQAEVTALGAEVADMRLAQQEQIARARAESQEVMRRMMEEHRVEMEVLRAELETKMLKLEGRLREAEAEEEEMRERLRSREDEFAAEMATMRSSMLEVGKIGGGNRREVELLESQVRGLQAEVDAAKARGWSDGEALIEELRKELRDVSRELDESRLGRAMEVERLQSRVREKEGELAKLAEVTERAQEERKAELALLRSEVERGGGGDGDGVVIKRLQAKAKEKEVELKSMWEAFEELKKERDVEQERARAEVEGLKAEVQKLRARLEAGGEGAVNSLSDDEREQLAAECAAAKAEVEKLRSKLRRSMADAVEAARDLQREMRDGYEAKLKSLHDEALVAKAESDKIRADLLAAEESLLAVKASQVEMQERYEAEIASMRKLSISKSSSFVVWPQDEVQQEHEEEVMALRAQVEDAHERTSAASSQAETLRLQLASMENAVQVAEAAYKEEVAVLQAEVEALRSQAQGVVAESKQPLQHTASLGGRDLPSPPVEAKLREEFVHELEEAIKREEVTQERAEKAEVRTKELEAQAKDMADALRLVEEDQKKLREEFVSELESSCIREHAALAEAEILRAQLRELQEGEQEQKAEPAVNVNEAAIEKLKAQLLDVQGTLQAALYTQSKLKEDYAKQSAILVADLQAEQAKSDYERADAERLRVQLSESQTKLEELEKRQEEVEKEHSLALEKLQSAADSAAEEAAVAKGEAEQRMVELGAMWERLQAAEMELGTGPMAIQISHGNGHASHDSMGQLDWPQSNNGMMMVSLERSTKVEVLQREANELAIQLSEVTNEVIRLRAVVADLEKQLQTEEEEVMWLQRKLRDHEFALQALPEGNGAQPSEPRLELPNLAEDTEAHLGALMARRHEVGERTQDYSITRLTAAKSLAEKMRSEVAALRARLAEAEARALDAARGLNGSVDSEQGRLGPSKSYRERANENAALREACTAAQLEAAAAHEEVESLRAKLAQLSDSENLRQRVMDAEEEVEWLQEQLRSAQDSAGRLCDTPAQLNRLNSSDSSKSIVHYDEALVLARSEVADEIEMLRSQLRLAESNLEAANGVILQRQSDGTANGIQQQTGGEEVIPVSEAAELRWRLQCVERDAAVVRERSSDAIDGYLAEIERLRSELVEAQSATRNMSRLDSKLKELKEEAAASKEEAKRARLEVEMWRSAAKGSKGATEAASSFQSRLGTSDDELLKLKLHLHEVEGTLLSTEKARARLEETLAGANAEAESLRSHLDAGGTHADNTTRELRSRIDDLQRRATRAETEAAELRAKLRTSEVAERECDWLKKKLREVTADYTALQEFAKRMRATKRTPSASPEKPIRKASSRGPSPAKRRGDALARELQEERMRHTAEVASLEMMLREQGTTDPVKATADREVHDARFGQRLRDVVGMQQQQSLSRGGARKLHNGIGGGLAVAVARNSVQGPTGSHRLTKEVGGEYPFPELSDTTDDDMPTPVYLADPWEGTSTPTASSTPTARSNGDKSESGFRSGKSSRQAGNRWHSALGKLKSSKRGGSREPPSP